jgi:uncharacterized membrane protein
VRGASGVSRLSFISDAVFAVAMVLLVVHVRIPEPWTREGDFHDALGDVVPELLGFFFSFAVLGMFWIEHRRLLDRAEPRGEGLTWLNLAFLACIAVAPFPAAILGKHMGVPLGVILYAGWATTTGLVAAVLWRHAAPGGHVPRRVLAIPLVFLLGVPLAGPDIDVGEYRFALAPIFWAVALPAVLVRLRDRGEAVDRAPEPLLEPHSGPVPEDLRSESDVRE